jgi:small-conductance mechanosensitive channel
MLFQYNCWSLLQPFLHTLSSVLLKYKSSFTYSYFRQTLLYSSHLKPKKIDSLYTLLLQMRLLLGKLTVAHRQEIPPTFKSLCLFNTLKKILHHSVDRESAEHSYNILLRSILILLLWILNCAIACKAVCLIRIPHIILTVTHQQPCWLGGIPTPFW